MRIAFSIVISNCIIFVDDVDISGCNHGFCKIHPRLRFACGRSCCMCIAFVWGMCAACGLHVVRFSDKKCNRVFWGLVVTMVCAIGGGPGFRFNSIEACPGVHVCVAVGFQGLAFGMVHARHVDVAHPLHALQWIEVNPIEKVIQMMSQNGGDHWCEGDR